MQHSSMLLSESLEAFIEVKVILIHTLLKPKCIFKRDLERFESWRMKLWDDNYSFMVFLFRLEFAWSSIIFNKTNSFILKIPYTFVMKSFLIVKYSKNPSSQLGEFLIFKNIPKIFLESNYNLEINTILKLTKNHFWNLKSSKIELENTK